MANNHAVVRTDNLFGTDVRAGLVSIKYIVTTGSGAQAVDTPTAIENGNVLKVGPLMDGEREIFKGSAPAANTDLKDIVLVASPEVLYDERLRNLDDFINEADMPCRGYRLHKGDIFSVTAEALLVSVSGKTTPEVGNLVELQAGTKLKVVASATSGSTQVGKVIHVEKVGRYTYYAILVG